MIKTTCLMALVAAISTYGNPPEPQKPAAAPPAAVEPAKPAAPDKGIAEGPKDKSGSQLQLTGITFVVPAGWESQQIQPGAMAPKAVYQIPAQKTGDEVGIIRITHYPEMKGKDDMNIDRWISQVAKADGQPAARADAKIEKTETGNIRLTTVDVTGSVKMTMRDTGKPDHRMIAAIVDHPKGPHFIVAAGPAAAMKTWEADILKFLKSAQVTDK